jgi:hypothetical protein
MPQKQSQVGQHKRHKAGHNSSRAEIRNQSAYGKLILKQMFKISYYMNSESMFKKLDIKDNLLQLLIVTYIKRI